MLIYMCTYMTMNNAHCLKSIKFNKSYRIELYLANACILLSHSYF